MDGAPCHDGKLRSIRWGRCKRRVNIRGSYAGLSVCVESRLEQDVRKSTCRPAEFGEGWSGLLGFLFVSCEDPVENPNQLLFGG
jgi:hypothetical protein